jgi:hypothetical protein
VYDTLDCFVVVEAAQKKKTIEKKKAKNSDESAFEESDDGDEEGRELDYISDSSEEYVFIRRFFGLEAILRIKISPFPTQYIGPRSQS